MLPDNGAVVRGVVPVRATVNGTLEPALHPLRAGDLAGGFGAVAVVDD